MTASQASSSARGSAEAEQRAARGSSTEIPAGGEVNKLAKHYPWDGDEKGDYPNAGIYLST